MAIRSIKKGIVLAINTAVGSFGYEMRKVPLAQRNRLWLKDYNISTVIDIGANIGQFALSILKVFPGVRVYSFEPLAHCFSVIRKLSDNYENWEVFPFALGETEQQVEMFRSGFAPSSSLLKMTDRHKTLFPRTADISSEQTAVKRLDDIAHNLKLEKDILVKLDVQGFEGRVIKGGQNTLRHAKVILSEVSFEKLYEDQDDFHTIYSLLYELGFQFVGCDDQSYDKKTGLPIQADALFVRKGESNR